MKEQSKIEKNLAWLLSNARFLSIRKIEQELQMPSMTLTKFVNGSRGLPDNWKEVVIEWVKSFRK